METIIETERLILRQFDEADAEAFYAFNSDPEVMRYTGEPPCESVEVARSMLRAYPDYAKHGYGRWAVVYKPDDRVIGFNGLKYLEDLKEVDLGYRLLPAYWGLGIATESSLAVVKWGFETLGLDEIIGLVLPQNGGSVRVLEKCGMSHVGDIEYHGEQVQRWLVKRPAA